MTRTLIIITYFFSINLLSSEASIVSQTDIFKNLRCLVCQGQSVADSNSEFSQTIKLVVKDLVDAGKSEKEIYDFLIEKYGDWIVYKPPINKTNFLLWTIPYIILISGGIIIFFMLKKRLNS